MSITTGMPGEEAAAERWRQWQQRYAESSRKSAKQVRIVFTVLFTVVAALLAMQLFSPFTF